MRFINQAYTDTYGIEPQSYIGKSDLEVWDRDTAELFRANDRAVMHGGVARHSSEKIKNELTQRTQHLDVVKFPVLNLASDIIGVGGIVRGFV